VPCVAPAEPPALPCEGCADALAAPGICAGVAAAPGEALDATLDGAGIATTFALELLLAAAPLEL
jgi:hypothetical protein